LNEFPKVANKEKELVKNNIKEIDLAGLEDSLKQYSDTAVSSIPQPDLTDFLARSDVHNMPTVQIFLRMEVC
jgi:hypothetical protein